MNTVQPIRDQKKIKAMKAVLKSKNIKYYMLFVLGINTGLRISDLLKLTVEDVAGKDHITLVEKKTGKTKRFLINTSLQKELQSYIRSSGLHGSDFLFKSREGNNQPIGRVQAYRVLNEAGSAVGLSEIGTHTLRKTFGYWHYQRYHDVAILQGIFNHSAPSITLRYIGITDDMRDETMRDFFL